MKISLCCFNISETNKKICWAITNSCNYACNYCFSNYCYDKSNMSIDTIDKAIKNIISHDIDYVILSGGEPLICPNLYYIINELTKNKINVSMCTNASLANEQVCKKLSQCGLRKVTVSFDDSNPNEFNRIKRKATAYFDSIMGIENLVENRFCVTINTVLQKKDISYTRDIISFWEKKGILKFSFSIPVCKNVVLDYTEDQIDNIERYLTELENEFCVEITLCYPQCNNNTCPSGKLIFGMHTNGIVDKCLVKEYIE